MTTKQAPPLKRIHSTVTLSDRTSRGLPKHWRGHVLKGPHGEIFTQTEAWQGLAGGGESEHKFSEPKRIAGKNSGKANATAPRQQAIAEIGSLAARQRHKGYLAPGESAQTRRRAMLAHNYHDHGHRMVFPCLGQPKLDGLRALEDQTHGFWTRNRLPFPANVTAHLDQALADLPLPAPLDGELILPTEAWSFQDTVRACKRFDFDLSPNLHYWIFDLADPDTPFYRRWDTANQLVAALGHPMIHIVEMVPINSADELPRWHDYFAGQGYEGLILRDPHALYKPGDRVVGLQKYKTFLDAEFRVVDVLEADGNFAGAAIYVCVTPEGRQFSVNPDGNLEARREIFRNRRRYVGKRVTVRFQNYSDDNLPRFPTRATVRERVQG